MVACLLGVLNVRLKYQRTAHTAEVCFGLKLQEGTTRPRVNKVVKRLLMCELYNGQQVRFLAVRTQFVLPDLQINIQVSKS